MLKIKKRIWYGPLVIRVICKQTWFSIHAETENLNGVAKPPIAGSN